MHKSEWINKYMHDISSFGKMKVIFMKKILTILYLFNYPYFILAMANICQYPTLYRLLRSDEDPTNGITAKLPGANVFVHDHVSSGSSMSSQYISTSASWGAVKAFAVKAFANHSVTSPKRVACINTAPLQNNVFFMI